MGLIEIISKVSDPYDRQARLWPALLAIFPLTTVVSLLYGPKLSAVSNVSMAIVSCGGLFLMMNMSREMGKRLEPKLFERWGGKPTTQILRHRDNTIDSITKQRYHVFLAQKINALFPNPEQEAAKPEAADEVYASAVRWLINQTRDTKKFELLFKENVSYGFRRNIYGMRSLCVIVCIGCIWLVLLNQKVINWSSAPYIDTKALFKMTDAAILAVLVSLAMLAIWVFVSSEKWVRSAAFTYAETLFRSCDFLERK